MCFSAHPYIVSFTLTFVIFTRVGSRASTCLFCVRVNDYRLFPQLSPRYHIKLFSIPCVVSPSRQPPCVSVRWVTSGRQN
ncbi:hypothetical protein BJV78DRAFT_1180905, partial [Lactifluus subvellereus]